MGRVGRCPGAVPLPIKLSPKISRAAAECSQRVCALLRAARIASCGYFAQHSGCRHQKTKRLDKFPYFFFFFNLKLSAFPRSHSCVLLPLRSPRVRTGGSSARGTRRAECLPPKSPCKDLGAASPRPDSQRAFSAGRPLRPPFGWGPTVPMAEVAKLLAGARTPEKPTEISVGLHEVAASRPLERCTLRAPRTASPKAAPKKEEEEK